MRENLILVGGGSLAMEILGYICDVYENKKMPNIFFFSKSGNKSDMIRIYKKIKFLKKIPRSFNSKNSNFVICTGDEKKRDQYFTKFKKKFKALSIVHPTAYISKTSKIFDGSIVCPNAIIAPFAKIKKNVVINSSSQIGHHSVIGESSVISTGVIISGKVKIGKKCFVGSNSTVMQNLSIGNNSKIASTSALYKNLNSNNIAIGNPAKSKKLYYN